MVADNIASKKTRKRRVESLNAMFGPDIILAANKALLKENGNKEVSKILDAIQDKDECKIIADKLKKSVTSQMSPEEALALIINARLTASDYQKMYDAAKRCGRNLYPSYKKVPYICKPKIKK